MPPFDPKSVTRVGARSLDVVGYRHQAPGRRPESGEGARRVGGRYNPPRSFPVLYLCATLLCAVAEFARLAHRQGLAPKHLLPREVWKIKVNLNRVLDLTDDMVLSTLGLQMSDLVRDEYRLTNEIGKAAHEYRFQAVLAPSATAVNRIIAVFTNNLGVSILRSELLKRWENPTDLTS